MTSETVEREPEHRPPDDVRERTRVWPSIPWAEVRRNGVPPPATRRISPYARRLASQVGLRVADLVGTGPGGEIGAKDVRRAVADAAGRGAAWLPSAAGSWPSGSPATFVAAQPARTDEGRGPAV